MMFPTVPVPNTPMPNFGQQVPHPPSFGPPVFLQIPNFPGWSGK
jgi:hypothetical protein